MKKNIITIGLALAAAVPVLAAPYGDLPDSRHAWAVHDRNRPNPPKVSANPGTAPSDAKILFDGSEASFAANWCDKDGAPSKWRCANGAIESVKKAGYIYTRESFGDCQLHIEWAAPVKVEGVGQARGNSGVFLMGNYEVQVLDSYETDPSKDPNPNPNYADGQAGAVYAENPPQVNASRAPGEWQTYDIVFHQPVWKNGRMLWPGSLTVFHNGVLVQDHWEMEGLTTHRVRRPLAPHAERLPLQLQDHGNPVRFRNIWIRDIPSRYANTTHGGPATDTAAVMALRAKTAASLFAKIPAGSGDSESVARILEVLSYSKDAKYVAACERICASYLKKVEGMDEAAVLANKDAITAVGKAFEVMRRCGALDGSCPLYRKVADIAARHGWKIDR